MFFPSLFAGLTYTRWIHFKPQSTNFFLYFQTLGRTNFYPVPNLWFLSCQALAWGVFIWASSFIIDILYEDCRPVDQVEQKECGRNDILAHRLDLDCEVNTKGHVEDDGGERHLVAPGLPAGPEVGGDHDELEDAGEHKDHANQHPDVQEGDVGDARHVLSDLCTRGSCAWKVVRLLTALNMAVRVRRVVMPMPTRPGTDSGGTNRESQAITTNTGGGGTVDQYRASPPN